MASWATWTFATMLLATGLTGCVKPYPEEDDVEPWQGHGCFTSYECCVGCGEPPRPSPQPPTRWPECPTYGASFARASFLTCALPEPPHPFLAPLTPWRLLQACDACANASIATDGERLFVATEPYLLVASGFEVRTLRMPSDGLRAPHAALDAMSGRLWLVALDASLPLPALALFAYDGGSDVARVATLDALAAPPLLATTRASVAPLDEGALVVLEGEGAAWAVRYAGGAFSAAERLTPLGGDALVGRPVADARGRVIVPYAYAPRDPLQQGASLLIPSVASTSLHFASLADADGAWTQHGGMVVQGARSAPAVETDARGVSAFAWIDGSGAMRRIESWDDGTAWGTPEPWSEARSRASGAPASARALDGRVTGAWWEPHADGARLVVARALGTTPEAREVAARLPAAPAEAALALLRDGRAVVAWVDGSGDVWAGVEAGTLPSRGCDDAGHCRRHA